MSDMGCSVCCRRLPFFSSAQLNRLRTKRKQTSFWKWANERYELFSVITQLPAKVQTHLYSSQEMEITRILALDTGRIFTKHSSSWHATIATCFPIIVKVFTLFAITVCFWLRIQVPVILFVSKTVLQLVKGCSKMTFEGSFIRIWIYKIFQHEIWHIFWLFKNLTSKNSWAPTFERIPSWPVDTKKPQSLPSLCEWIRTRGSHYAIVVFLDFRWKLRFEVRFDCLINSPQQRTNIKQFYLHN